MNQKELDYWSSHLDGVSGTKKYRPAFNRMMKDVEEGQVNRVRDY